MNSWMRKIVHIECQKVICHLSVCHLHVYHLFSLIWPWDLHSSWTILYWLLVGLLPLNCDLALSHQPVLRNRIRNKGTMVYSFIHCFNIAENQGLYIAPKGVDEDSRGKTISQASVTYFFPWHGELGSWWCFPLCTDHWEAQSKIYGLEWSIWLLWHALVY